MLAGCLVSPFLMNAFDKKKLLLVLLIVMSVLSIGFYFVSKESIVLMFVLNILISMASGPMSPLTWSMYADAADYNEWKTGNRATAMTFSAATFSQKLGSAIGSAAMLGLLSYLGYKANSAQNDASLEGINFLQTALPGFFVVIAVIVVLFYNLSNDKLEQIEHDLDQRSLQHNT